MERAKARADCPSIQVMKKPPAAMSETSSRVSITDGSAKPRGSDTGDAGIRSRGILPRERMT